MKGRKYIKNTLSSKLSKKIKQPLNYKKNFSSVYDELMTKTKYEKWKILITEIVEKYKIKKTCALDVACGTGEISKILLDLGFSEVYGLDKSPDMLNIAVQKLLKYGTRFKTIKKDMTNFNYPNKYNLIVSFYDSINYLLDPNQVKKFLLNVESSLVLGGFAIFDMNTKEHIHISQKNPDRNFQIKGGNVLFKFGGEKDIWRLDIKGKIDNNLLNETHLERGYSSEEITHIIKGSKLNLIELFAETKLYWDDKEHLSRQYYIIRKNL